MKLNWKEDSFAESRMKALGLDWKIATVPIKEIDIKGSLENNARHAGQELKAEVASDFATAMGNGDAFPRIVLLNRPRDKWIIGGNHRIAAVQELGVESVEAYIISSGDEKASKLLPRILNRGHGIPQYREEAIEQAIYSVEHFGLEVAEAADLFSIHRRSLLRAMRVQEMRAELASAAINASQISDSNIDKLGSIQIHSVRNALARTITEHQIGADMIRTFIDDVFQEKRSETNQMAIIAKWQNACPKKAVAEMPKRIVKTPLRTRFLMGVGTIEKLSRGIRSLSQLQITNQNEQAQLRPKLAKVSKFLASLAKI